jgi:DNA-binding helix-hairpin-helix protein with protein kinase domain
MEKDPLEDSMLAAVFPGHYDKQRDEANAKLIAAAPALLDALRDQVQKCWERSGVGLPDHEADCEKCRPARAAIAAAVGDAGKEGP